MNIVRMRVENRKNPLGIDQERPTFSWNVDTEKENWKQRAYQIFVSEKEENIDAPDSWDSGIVEDSTMVNVFYEGKALKPQTRYFWKVKVFAKDGEVCESETASFETGMLHQETLWHGIWIGEVNEHSNHLYRKAFRVEKEIAKARIYICGLGHYQLFANGKRVENYELEPGWTTYTKHCLYTVYDMTPYLEEGKNALGVMLGNGMYHVNKTDGRYTYFPRSYGFPKLLVQLNITYKDGTQSEVYTDESWKCMESPFTFNSIYGGEEFHAERMPKDFSLGSFYDEDWSFAEKVEALEGELVANPVAPLKVMQTLNPVSVKEIKPGYYLYDLGKNFSGWVRIRVKKNQSDTGNRIKMKPGEILKADGTPDQKVTGKNYSWDYYMSEEDIQEYAPHFTYTGFRYLQVEGAVPKELAKPGEKSAVIESLVGEFIYPDMEIMGEFSCSNTLYNQIHEIILQAMLSNIKSIFTDCPHREKLGWLEETHLIGPAIMFNYDVHNLYEKVEMDMQDAQRDSGLIADICPEYVTGFDKWHTGFVDSPEWGSACIINLWYLHKKYGDTAIFERYYDTMKKYLDYLTTKTHHHVLHHGLGDWLDIGPCTPHSQNTPVPVVATNIYYYDLHIMEQVAIMLGKEEDAKAYREQMALVKEEYNLQFFDDQTNRYANGSQAAQAMSLVTGLAREDRIDKILEQLVRDIKGHGYATTAGDVGHPFVTAALTMFGASDVMNEMMKVTDRPGYGYQVKCGATTLAEEWDGPDPDRPHGSQNHFMLGSGEEWFYAGLAGIQGMRQNMDFDKILIKPHFAEGVDEVKAWHRHPYGVIRVEWKRNNNEEISLKITIPPNTEGILALAGREEKKVGSGNYEFVLKQEGEQ